jgi:hypothetical protein
MKTKSIISSIIVLFLLAIILAGCREEIDPPILRVEIKPTQVAYNGSATLTWQGENLASLKINGENQSSLNSGSMTLNNLIENTTYSFVGVGFDGTTISQSVSILVDKPKPELIVTVTPNTVIPYKESATVSWQGKDLASLKVNDVDYLDLKTGSISLTKLVADTTIHFVAVGLDGSNINQSVLVKVAEPTRTDILCGYKWGLIESKYWYKGRYVYVKIPDDVKAERHVFTKDGRYNVFDGSGEIIGNGKWSWIGKDSINVGGSLVRYELSDINLISYSRNDSTIVTLKAYPL